MGVHTFVYKHSGGRIGHHLPGVGAPMLLLDHVGAKSGIKRTSPLLYVDAGDDVAIIASKGGYPKHPAWFHNLKANPDTTIQIGTETRPIRARVATGEERDRLWDKAANAYGGYEGYQERTDRKIPVVVLERR
jgi:deazaflavin-dependent oxidoreductase (nitroreductase family)